MAARPIRLLVGCFGAAWLAGCAHRAAEALYMWESFPTQQYATLLRTGDTPDAQIAALEEHAEKARGAGAALPPGFRAHLGMLKLSVGRVDEARQLLLAEKAAFPESAPYMDQLLKRLDGPNKDQNPA